MWIYRRREQSTGWTLWTASYLQFNSIYSITRHDWESSNCKSSKYNSSRLSIILLQIGQISRFLNKWFAVAVNAGLDLWEKAARPQNGIDLWINREERICIVHTEDRISSLLPEFQPVTTHRIRIRLRRTFLEESSRSRNRSLMREGGGSCGGTEVGQWDR